MLLSSNMVFLCLIKSKNVLKRNTIFVLHIVIFHVGPQADPDTISIPEANA